MRRYGVLLLLAALVAAPIASGAKRTHLKLTAVVTGQKLENVMGFKQNVTFYSVKQGSKKVGTLTLNAPNCAGNTCPESGTANLTVGKVTGKAMLKTTTKFTGCPPCSPPIPVKFKSNTGTIFNAKHGSEAIRVNGKFPRTKGSKVTFVLSY
jgi:hypothetical protein